MALITPSPVLLDASTRTRLFGATSETSGPRNQDAPQQDAPVLYYEVSVRSYRVFWLLILSLRGGCAAFLLIMMYVYFFLADPLMGYYAKLITPAGGSQLKQFGIAFGVLAGMHCVNLVKMVICSIYCRNLVLDWPEDGVSKFESAHSRIMSMTSFVVRPFLRSFSSESKEPPTLSKTRLERTELVLTRFIQVMKRTAQHVKTVRRQLFHCTGVFGIESVYFHWRFFLREPISAVAMDQSNVYWCCRDQQCIDSTYPVMLPTIPHLEKAPKTEDDSSASTTRYLCGWCIPKTHNV